MKIFEYKVPVSTFVATVVAATFGTLYVAQNPFLHPNVETGDYSAYERVEVGFEPKEETQIVTSSGAQEEPTTECEEVEKTVYYELPLSNDEQDIVNSVCEKFEIDNRLIYGMALTESTCNPDLIGDSGESFGMLQIQPKWWSHYFDQYGCSDWLSIKDNVTVSCAIITEFSARFGGDIRSVLNAYNTGDGSCHNGYADRVFEKMENLEVRKGE